MEKKLSELKYGERGIVKSIKGDLRNKIAGMGIRVNKRIRMATKQPIKGPVVITVDESNISLGLGIAENITIEVEK